MNFIGESIDQAFIQACVNAVGFTNEGKEDLKIVFTPIHGTSIVTIPEALKKAGFKMFGWLRNNPIQVENFQQ